MKFKKRTNKQIDKDEDKREREYSKHFKFGSFGSHELVDRTEMLMNFWNEYIIEHPRVMMTPQFDKLAQQVSGLMYDLYNMASIAHAFVECPNQSWDLSHLDADSKRQIEEYDAEKALREKWTGDWTDDNKKKFLKNFEEMKKKEAKKEKRDKRKAAEMEAGA